jgi:hypothetical protein
MQAAGPGRLATLDVTPGRCSTGRPHAESLPAQICALSTL